jgi:hypothetical protein
MSALTTSDLGTLLRRAQRARRAARFLSSLTVIVGMVIRRYYHVRLLHLLRIRLRGWKPFEGILRWLAM